MYSNEDDYYLVLRQLLIRLSYPIKLIDAHVRIMAFGSHIGNLIWPNNYNLNCLISLRNTLFKYIRVINITQTKH